MEEINDFIELQLRLWPEAAERYKALAKVERKAVGEWYAQYNPARIVSTGAKVDAASIKERKCFLCKANRPECQLAIPIAEGWELLLNPFPIFPVHFTIASTKHIPQIAPPKEMVMIADRFPGLCIFFNGAKAGASAPDHAHMQAVLAVELPLLNAIEKDWAKSDSGWLSAEVIGWPHEFICAEIPADQSGVERLSRLLAATGKDPSTGTLDAGLRNVYAWKSLNDGRMRMLVIPRRAHRPSCYGDEGYLISPGAIDMAGVIITPRREDFDRLTPELIAEIIIET